jgi:RND family efflux transporter MFP subunit
LETARKAYERTKMLYDAGVAAQSDVENAENTYNSLQSGSVEAAVAEAEAALMAAQEAVDNCNITAPVSGIVGRIDASVGELVTTNTTVAVISESRQMNAEILVGESDISKIKLNSQVDVYVKSVSDQPISGTVTAIASVLASNSDMYPVTITIDNVEGAIKSGMYAEVSVNTSSVKHALCVPLAAVLPSDGVNIVYTVDNKNRAKRVEVNTGISDQEYV